MPSGIKHATNTCIFKILEFYSTFFFSFFFGLNLRAEICEQESKIVGKSERCLRFLRVFDLPLFDSRVEGEGRRRKNVERDVCNIRRWRAEGWKKCWQVRLPGSVEAKRSWLRNSTLDVTLSIGFFK